MEEKQTPPSRNLNQVVIIDFDNVRAYIRRNFLRLLLMLLMIVVAVNSGLIIHTNYQQTVATLQQNALLRDQNSKLQLIIDFVSSANADVPRR